MDPIWTAAEIETWKRRYVRLQQEENRNEQQATKLADDLQQRDRDGDDRRICPECRNWRNRKCTQGHRPMPYFLQRHDCMQLRGAKPQVSAG